MYKFQEYKLNIRIKKRVKKIILVKVQRKTRHFLEESKVISIFLFLSREKEINNSNWLKSSNFANYNFR